MEHDFAAWVIGMWMLTLAGYAIVGSFITWVYRED